MAARVDGTGIPQNAIEAGRRSGSGTHLPADPDAIARAYFVDERGGERRYYEDYQKRSLTMRADPNRISTHRQDLVTIRAMLAIAEVRGWSALKVAGSAEFRREAWIEAQARGLPVQGYQATSMERQEAERRRSERSKGQTAPSFDRSRTEPARSEPLHGAKAPATNGTARQASSRIKEASLSQDGRLVFAALSSRIDRQMARLDVEGKAELKAFALAELSKREGIQGQVVLTPAQRVMATAPLQSQGASPSRSTPSRADPEPPRRVRSR